MNIQVFDFKNAPKWVQLWNMVNLTIFGFAVGRFFGVGLEPIYISLFTMYFLGYAFTIGRFFIPKRHVTFPKGFLLHFFEQWAAR